MQRNSIRPSYTLVHVGLLCRNTYLYL